MPNSSFFSMNRFKMGATSDRVVAITKFLLVAALFIGINTSFQGCAANKCDCPRFGGQRLRHT